MKLILSFLLLCVSTVFSENVSSQIARVNIVANKLSVKEIIKQIEDQTDYLFVYSNEKVDLSHRVSLNASDISVINVLNRIFENSDIGYAMEGNNILLMKKEAIRQQKGKVLKGAVKDQSGEPVIGANVVVKGTTNGTVTDVDGNFTLEVSNTDVLLVSFIGYMTREIPVKERNILNINLIEDTKSLDEVVVVGYGTQKKVNLTGAVNVISNEDFENRQASTVSQLLQGAAPGFNFDIGSQDGFEPGATMNISIRGMGSLNGGSPYVVIDGFPGDLNNLNPEDIESVSVLKDAAASAIYGARAPYGVILVTTKKGKKNEKVSVSYTGNLIVKTAQKLPESLDSYTWTRILNEAGDNMGGHPFSNETIDRVIAYQKGDFEYIKNSIPDWPEGATIFGAMPEGNVWNNANLNYANTDWWDIYFGNSVNQKHDISLHGGTDKVSYYFSAGYMDDSSVLNYGTDYFKRMNTLGKISVAITDWWDFGYETRFAKKIREKPNMTNEGDYSFLYRHISRNYPITPLYDGFGNYMFESHIPSMQAGTDKQDDIDFWNNFRMELRPLKGWKINADFAYNVYNQEISEVEKSIYTYDINNQPYENGISIPNNLTRKKYIKKYWTTNIYTSYDFDINEEHNFTILAGMQFERGDESWVQGYKTDLISEKVPSFPTATGDALLAEALAHNATESYFARLNYNYKEKYLFEANVRYDGSSRFDLGHKWGVFPSFSGGWRISEEAFMKNTKNFLSNLKLRASWGSIGNQIILKPDNTPENYPYIPSMSPYLTEWLVDGQKTTTLNAPAMVSSSFSWEKVYTLDFGVDFGFFDNRFNGTFDWYRRDTKGMLAPGMDLPWVVGATAAKQNAADLKTYGWELELNWRDRINKDWSYRIGFNLYDSQSEITKYNNETNLLGDKIYRKGMKMGEIWGYVTDRFYTEDDFNADGTLKPGIPIPKGAGKVFPGDVLYKNFDDDTETIWSGEGTADNPGDQRIIGNSTPRFHYGITAGISWKGLDLSIFLRGVGKRDYWRTDQIAWPTGGWGSLFKETLDFWTPTNTNAYYPRVYSNDGVNTSYNHWKQSKYLANASYLKLQNITLSYTLPKVWSQRLYFDDVKVFFSGENLYTWDHLPEGLETDMLSKGAWEYPFMRKFSFGINVTF